MYLHVGEEVLVRTKDIIAIIDSASANASSFMDEYFERKNESVINLAKGTVKSIVVTDDKIFFSPLSSGTLKKRSQKLSVQEF